MCTVRLDLTPPPWLLPGAFLFFPPTSIVWPATVLLPLTNPTQPPNPNDDHLVTHVVPDDIAHTATPNSTRLLSFHILISSIKAGRQPPVLTSDNNNKKRKAKREGAKKAKGKRQNPRDHREGGRLRPSTGHLFFSLALFLILLCLLGAPRFRLGRRALLCAARCSRRQGG